MQQYGYSKRSVFRARPEFAVETEKFQQLLEYFVGLEFLIFFFKAFQTSFPLFLIQFAPARLLSI